MISSIEIFWVGLHKVLTDFSGSIAINGRQLIKEIVRTPANEAFPLRSYLSIRTNLESDELAVTIDLHSADERWSIQSGIYWEDGLAISVGPSMEILIPTDQSVIESNFEAWLTEFREFLQSNRNTVISQLQNIA